MALPCLNVQCPKDFWPWLYVGFVACLETVVLHQWESETGDYQSEVEKDKLTTVANFEKLTFRA